MRAFDYKIENVKLFYKFLKEYPNFWSIDPEKKERLDYLIAKQKGIFDSEDNFLIKQYLLTEKLRVSSKYMGLLDKDEIAYFYINVLDPNLLFLEIFESANTLNELKQLCIKNFGIYDIVMINLEKKYNEKFKVCSTDELWARNKIKR